MSKHGIPFCARCGHPRTPKKVRKRPFSPTQCFTCFLGCADVFRHEVLVQTLQKATFYWKSNSKSPNHALEKGHYHRNTQYSIAELATLLKLQSPDVSNFLYTFETLRNTQEAMLRSRMLNLRIVPSERGASLPYWLRRPRPSSTRSLLTRHASLFPKCTDSSSFKLHNFPSYLQLEGDDSLSGTISLNLLCLLGIGTNTSSTTSPTQSTVHRI